MFMNFSIAFRYTQPFVTEMKKYAKLLKVVYSLAVNCVLSDILISLIFKDFHLISLMSYSKIKKIAIPSLFASMVWFDTAG